MQARSSRCVTAGFLGIVGLVLATRAGAQAPAVTPADMAARLSDAPAATEYWDLTGQFGSGHRLFVRFLITNEGPGSHTGVAVGHLILPSGAITPIKWGRTSDDWSISPDGRRLKVGKAVLEITRTKAVLDVNTDKHGIKIHVEVPRSSPAVVLDLDPGVFGVEVVTPLPANGTVWLQGMAEPVAVNGTMALTHSWFERSETEVLGQRNELLAATGDIGMYLSEVGFLDGRRRTSLIVTRAGQTIYRADPAPLTWAGAIFAGDTAYPVSAIWEIRSTDLQLSARLQRLWLRWNPLDLIPAPFRWIIGWKARPQRVWADADVALTVAAQSDRAKLEVRSTGIAVVTFGQPAAGH